MRKILSWLNDWIAVAIFYIPFGALMKIAIWIKNWGTVAFFYVPFGVLMIWIAIYVSGVFS
jgi:hypothetical protein